MTLAIQYSRVGGPDVLSLAQVPMPVPGAGEVLIRVEAAGVNPLDIKQRSGVRPVTFDGPRRAGFDGAGIVLAVGTGVEGLRTGMPVAFTDARGAYATETIAPAEAAFPRPAAVSAESGAAVGIPAGTGYQVVRSLAIGADDVLLVHGGSGSVGQTIIQFAVMLGARVVATCSDARAELVRSLGAEPVRYGDGLQDRLSQIAPHGFTVAVDCVGTDEAIHTSLAVVPDHDRIATIVRGPDAASFGIRAFSGGSPDPLTTVETRWRREAIPLTLALMAAGTFHIELGARYSLAEAARAQADAADGARGKLLIIP